MKKLSALVALALCVAPAAYAQDGASCATAIPLTEADNGLVVDTTGATGWINNYGPLVSPSNDVVYTFTTPAAGATGSIAATAASYQFALYLLSSCTAGAGPTPIGATATVGTPIQLSAPVTSPSTQYWLAVTGTAAGGAGANGTVTLGIVPTLPVTLQSFEIN